MTSKIDPFTAKLVSNLIEQLKAGTAPWQKAQPEAFVLPYNPATSEVYSGGNLITLMAVATEKGYSDPRWFAYKGAQEAGGQVRGNEKGTAIKKWITEKEVEVNKDGQPILDKNGDPVTKITAYQTAGYVFNAAQIENLPELEKIEVPFDSQERAEKILKLSGAEIQEKKRAKPQYIAKNDRIVLPPRDAFDDQKNFYSTALRELGHWTGHESRLNRDIVHPVGSEGYAREELRTQIFSMMINSELGLPYDPSNQAAHTKNWIKIAEEDPGEIFRAAADAEQMYSYAIGLIREKEIEEPENQKSRPDTGFILPKINPVVPLTQAEGTLLAADSNKMVIDVTSSSRSLKANENNLDGSATTGTKVGYVIDPVKKAELRESLKKQFVSRSEKELLSFDVAARHAEKQLMSAERVDVNTTHDVFTRIQTDAVAKTAIDEKGNLLVPVYDVHGKLKSCQSITPQGVKSFGPGSHTEGGIFIVGSSTDKLKTDSLVLVSASFENAAVINSATGRPVVVAFNDANLSPVAQAIRSVNPKATIAIFTERRYQAPHETDPGVAKAIEAANSVKGTVISPLTANAKSFVDVANKLGKDAIRYQVETSLQQKLQKIEPIVKERPKVQERARVGMSL